MTCFPSFKEAAVQGALLCFNHRLVPRIDLCFMPYLDLFKAFDVAACMREKIKERFSFLETFKDTVYRLKAQKKDVYNTTEKRKKKGLE